MIFQYEKETVTTESVEVDLPPCPFCGTDPENHEQLGIGRGKRSQTIRTFYCPNSDCIYPKPPFSSGPETWERAVALWSMRD